MPKEVDDAIATRMLAPRRVKGDEGEVEQYPLPDQIAAAKYLASVEAASKPSLGIRFLKVRPPGIT
jgi:hypothetical protein